MINFDTNSIILAVVGSLGLLGSVVVLTYSFRRNRMSNGRYQ